MRRALSVVVAGAIGLAAWVTIGALAFTAGGDAALPAGPIRLGLLPSSLWALAAAALAAAGLIWRPAAIATTPLLALVLLPWLPLAVPAAALVWSGPLGVAVWMAWALALVFAAGVRLPAWMREPRRGARAAFVIALAVYAAGLALAARTVPGGDEPHYLVIARSLIADGDLRIENNHRQREYLPFFEGELKPDYLRRGANGEIYSIHAPGLPALIAPAFALFGHRGAALFLAIVSAWGAALAWRLAFEVSGDADAAWFGFAAVALTAPFVLHAFTIYPDAVASVLVLTGLAAFVRSGERSDAAPETGPSGPPLTVSRAAWHGIALAYLPWLHTRYALLAAALGAAIVFRLVRTGRVRALAAFLAGPLVSACAWFAFFDAVYGTPNPAAPYGGYTQSAFAHIFPGLAGLLVDQQFGLLATAPVLVVGLAGLAAMLFSRRAALPGAANLTPIALALLLVVVPYAMATAAYRMWWGGFSGPARFLVPIVLPLAVPAAIGWTRARTLATRALAIWALSWSLGFAALLVAVDGGAMAYATRTPVAGWALWLGAGVDLARGLPSIHRGPLGVTLGQTAAWAAAIGLAWAVLRAAGNARQAAGRVLGVWAPIALAIASMAALSASWRIEGVTPLRPAASQAALIDRAAAITPRLGVWYEPSGTPWSGWRLRGVAETLSTLRVPAEADGRDPAALALPSLPAGRYRLHVQPGGAVPVRIDVSVGRSGTPAFSFDVESAATPGGRTARLFDFALPVRVSRLVVRAQGGTLAAGSVAVEPLAVSPRAAAAAGEADQAVAYGDAVAFFVGEGDTFAEPTGFWVKAGVEATVVVVDAVPGRSLAVRVRNAPVPNRVSLQVADLRRAWDLDPGAEQSVTLPQARDVRVSVLKIRAARGVRPADREPGNRDMRLLGVWVELVRI